MKRFADAVVHRALCKDATIFVELERRVQEKLVRQLLIGHATRNYGICAAVYAFARSATASDGNAQLPGCQFHVELYKRSRACNLGQLGPQPLDLRPELDLEIRVLGFVGWQLRLSLVQCNESVPDPAGKLGLIWYLPCLEALEKLEYH